MDMLNRVIAKKLYGGGGGSTEEEWYITDASYMFYNGARLDVKDSLLSKLKYVTTMSYMFYECGYLTELDVSKWDTSNVTTMSSMFTGCLRLTKLDVSKWDTGNVTNMSSMFNQCAKPTKLDVSKWDTGKVTSMSSMFSGCTSLTELDVSKWDTGNVTNMSSMFQSCKSLKQLIGFSATNKAGISIFFPKGASSGKYALSRLTFRTDLPEGVYSIRSAINIPYCSFERDGMVEMFNTLPDVSGLGLSSSYTTITITGNPCVTNATLTAEDEAIATAKGWTLVK
jgi:surface protein